MKTKRNLEPALGSALFGAVMFGFICVPVVYFFTGSFGWAFLSYPAGGFCFLVGFVLYVSRDGEDVSIEHGPFTSKE
ncbi:hypothetical protein K2P47_04060 [Patescibacteria group bacterium]|nr:hypothetical protein [Patescibacteria group bacterium]